MALLLSTNTFLTPTLLTSVGEGDTSVNLSSVVGIIPGYHCIFVDDELIKIVSFGLGTSVNGIRGIEGTTNERHGSGSAVYIGPAHYFNYRDPNGIPGRPPLTNPWINLLNGNVWFAEGDESGPNVDARRWVLQTTMLGAGPLGINSVTLTPSQ